MTSCLVKLCDWLETAVTYAGIALFACMISVVFYEVIMRYVFSAPTFWSEALARAAMIWLVMLGLARGIRRMENIRVDFLAECLPAFLRSVCSWLRYAVVIIFALAMTICGTELAFDSWSNVNAGFEVSMTWIYLAVPVAGVLILIFTIELIVTGKRGFF